MAVRSEFDGLGGRIARRIMAAAIFLVLATICGPLSTPAQAQTYSFSTVAVEGNERVDAATIVKFAGIAKGQPLSAGGLNDAYQRISQSGLFESVELVPSGGTLIIRVKEYPTISIINFEGNERLKDDQLSSVIQSKQNRVYSPSGALADADAIAKAYSDAGRFAARVEPRVIRRDGNRVDLVFEIREGAVSEVERISFTGNRSYSDRRLRQVLGTKQAGLLRTFVKADTFIEDRVAFDKQVLTDFYRSRGFIDFQILGASSEFSRERGAFFMTFNVREGLQYKIGDVTVVSEYPGVETAEYEKVMKLRRGVTYSPTIIDNNVSKMEAIALKQGINFLRVDPQIIRNPEDQTLDVVFVLTKGPRVFVERIDIEGNKTTLDKVVRRQFRTVEGDPFNPREIRDAAERIRALGFFTTADVNAKQGTTGDQVIVDVNVDEKPTGSLSFGASYSTADGLGFNVSLSESNLLGRGQYLSVSIGTTSDNNRSGITFVEPAFLDRDLKFRISADYVTSSYSNSFYDTKRAAFSTGLEFPIGDYSRLELRYGMSADEVSNVDPLSSAVLQAEEAQGSLVKSGLGYTLSYDTRVGGVNPKSSLLLRFNQDFNGLGGDVDSIVTSGLAVGETKIMQEEVTLRAILEGGAVVTSGADSRIVDRFSGYGKVRGFESNGYGPRDLAAGNQDALGGNFFASARFEAEFPLGLPTEYGVSGALFSDFGSVWGLDNTLGGAIDDSFHLRSSVGIAILWNTSIGPLRFNFAKPIMKESYDKEQLFDFSISTRF